MENERNDILEETEETKETEERPIIHLFLESKMDELIKISISERQRNGPGLLTLTRSAENNIDCRYIPVSMLVDNFRELFIKIYEHNPNSVLYFYYIEKNNQDENFIFQYDLDKNRFI